MVYVSSSGVIEDRPPWSLSRVIALFWGFLNFVFMFFKTLINPDMNKHGSRYTRDYRPGPRPPPPPRRRMGGFGSDSINTPDLCTSGGG